MAGQILKDLDATPEPFTVHAGLWGISAHASNWNGGSVVLQIVAADDVVWLLALEPTSADGVFQAYLMSGRYRLLLTGGTSAVLPPLAPVIGFHEQIITERLKNIAGNRDAESRDIFVVDGLRRIGK
jgi:hypothetical protein